MDKAKFNQKMGRQKYSKGGYIKKVAGRKYFDVGGIAANSNTAGSNGGSLTNTTSNGIGGIAGALGLNASSANINPGTNNNQLNNAYTGSNNAINAQVGLANTVNPGVQTGVNTQNQIENQELAMTQGAGPNPAQAQLAQATGTNVANQAALAAGQRGGAGNVGLMERQAAQTGAQTQQSAAGQAATLEAQQQIAAQNNAAGIAAQQVGQGQGATTALNTAQQNEQNILQNANTAANNSAVSMQGNINNVNAQASQGLIGGLTSGVSALAGLFEKGGEVHPVHGKQKLDFIHKMTKMGMEHYDTGGQVPATPPSPPIDPSAAQSVSDSFKGAVHSYADGGNIQGNPLIGAITGQPMGQPQAPQYVQSQASSGPGMSSAPAPQSADLGKAASQGFAAGQKLKNKNSDPMAGAQNLQVSDGSEFGGSQLGDSGVSGLPGAATSNPINPMDPSDQITQGDSGYTQNAAHGGEIWNIHPSQHAEYSANHFSQYFAKGGEAKSVDALVSANERYLNPDEVEQVKHGADPKKLGYKFPGKDKVPGKNSLKNDTIPVTLQEGGIVIPLSVEKTGNSDKMRLFTLKSLKATGRHMKKPGSMS